jgi:hypothetical protein
MPLGTLALLAAYTVQMLTRALVPDARFPRNQTNDADDNLRVP